MAVVKANYVKRGKGDRSRAKATIRYITHRRTMDNWKITRELFGYDGALFEEQAYQMINEAPKATIFYRFVIFPDPRREDKYKDLSIEDITIDTMIKLEKRIGCQMQQKPAQKTGHKLAFPDTLDAHQRGPIILHFGLLPHTPALYAATMKRSSPQTGYSQAPKDVQTAVSQ